MTRVDEIRQPPFPCPRCKGKEILLSTYFSTFLGRRESMTAECKCCGLGRTFEWWNEKNLVQYMVDDIIRIVIGKWLEWESENKSDIKISYQKI